MIEKEWTIWVSVQGFNARIHALHSKCDEVIVCIDGESLDTIIRLTNEHKCPEFIEGELISNVLSI